MSQWFPLLIAKCGRAGGALGRLCCVLLMAVATATVPAQDKPGSTEPEQVEKHFRAAQTFQVAADYDNAAGEYRSAIAGALEGLGNLRNAQEKFADAIQLLSSAASVAPASVDIRLDLAIAYFRSGDLATAKSAVEAVAAGHAEDFRVLNLLGKIHFLQGNFQAAADRLQVALKLRPDFDTAYSLALTDLMLKKPADAGILFDEMQASGKPDAELQMLIGIAYRESGYPEQALAHFSRALALDPQHARAHFALGLTYLLQGEAKHAEARREFETELRLHPGDATSQSFLAALESSGHKAAVEAARPPRTADAAGLGSVSGQANRTGQQELHAMLMKPRVPTAANAAREAEYVKSVSALLGEAYHNLGVMAARAGQFAEASDDFEQAAHWNPAIEALDRNWGLAAFRAQRYAQALVPLQRQFRRDPADMTLRQMLGVTYFMLDNFQQCAQVLGPVAGQLPGNPGLLYAAGVSLVRSGRAKEGAQVFARMLQQNSGSAEIHMLLGEAYVEQAEYPQAMAELAQALELDPKLPEAHYYRGKALFKQGRMDDAAQEYQSELALSPSSVPAAYELAYIRLEQHQADDAIRLLNQVLAQKPEYADAHYQLGKALLEKAEVKAAVEHLETAAKLDPSADYTYYQLGLAYRRDGQPDAAQKALQTYESLRAKRTGTARPAPQD